MSHSLRCRLKGLCYKKILTDREVARLCKALDVADAIEDIKAEIEGLQCDSFEVADFSGNRYTYEYLYKADVMAIIDKYISGKEKE